MKNTPVSFTLISAGMLAVLSALPLCAWSAVAGQFQFVAGDVRILAANGQSRPAQKGQDISEGETVVTGANASAQLKMIDGGILALRPESQLKMDAYVFKGREDGSEKANMSLVKGGLRAISGLIGKTNKQNYAITTPTATIGIRGTDHEPVVVLPPPPGQSAPNPPGTYDKVNVGQVALSNQAGSTLVNRNQVGFAGVPNLPPSVLLRVPDFYRVTPLPAQRQQQPTGQGANSQSSSNPGNAGNPSTTSAASGSEGGDAMRLNGGEGLPTANVVASGNAGGSVGGNTIGVTPSTPPQTVLTAKNALDQDVNLTTQTKNTSEGPVALDVVAAPPASALTGTFKGHYDLAIGGGSPTEFGNSSFGNLSTLTLDNNKLVGFNVLEQYLGDLYRVQLDGDLAESQRDANTGLVWGRFSSGSLSYSINIPGEGSSLAGTVPFPVGGLHYIVGTKPAPEYLARVLTGSYNYTKIGGTSPTDSLGNIGTLTDASLKVNFGSQLVEQAIVAFTMPDANWRMTATDVPLQGSGQFFACTDCSGSSLSVVRTQGTNSRSGIGSLVGTLTGSNLNGAALSYQVQDEQSNVPNSIQGVAALGVQGTAPDANTPYRATGISTGWKMTGSGTDIFSSYWPEQVQTVTQVAYKGTVEGGEGPVARIVDTPNHALEQFVGQAEYQRAGVDGLTNSGGPNSATVRIGTAVNQDVGSMAVDGMAVSWGRWAGGTIDIFNRDGTGAKLGTIDNADRSIHWLATSSLAGPLVNLPQSGTATYSLVGGGATAPTDTRGNVGTLTSATVDVYFTTMRVDAKLNLNINATNIGIAANQMALNSGGGFSSNSNLIGTTGNSALTCNGGTCGTNSMSYINGQLLGQNASAAAIAYGAALAPTVTNTNTVQAPQGSVISGVAVLKNAGPVPIPH